MAVAWASEALNGHVMTITLAAALGVADVGQNRGGRFGAIQHIEVQARDAGFG